MRITNANSIGVARFQAWKQRSLYKLRCYNIVTERGDIYYKIIVD